MVLPVIKQTILTFFKKILYLEGHVNRFIVSKVTAILLNWWILPTGGFELGRVCPILCSLRSRLQSAGQSIPCVCDLTFHWDLQVCLVDINQLSVFLKKTFSEESDNKISC